MTRNNRRGRRHPRVPGPVKFFLPLLLIGGFGLAVWVWQGGSGWFGDSGYCLCSGVSTRLEKVRDANGDVFTVEKLGDVTMLIRNRAGESVTFCGISGDAEPMGRTPTGGGYVSTPWDGTIHASHIDAGPFRTGMRALDGCEWIESEEAQ